VEYDLVYIYSFHVAMTDIFRRSVLMLFVFAEVLLSTLNVMRRMRQQRGERWSLSPFLSFRDFITYYLCELKAADQSMLPGIPFILNYEVKSALLTVE
jgi:hypothetical protein